MGEARGSRRTQRYSAPKGEPDLSGMRAAVIMWLALLQACADGRGFRPIADRPRATSQTRVNQQLGTAEQSANMDMWELSARRLHTRRRSDPSRDRKACFWCICSRRVCVAGGDVMM